MRLTSLKVEGLFDLFSYNIELDQEEDLTILTSPNGYGKTTVLNIIYNLFNYRFFYFQKLVFSEMVLSFDNQYRLNIRKTIDENKKMVSFFLYDETNRNVEIYEYRGSKNSV
jgi:predicted ATP-binding protein involved in virulence